MTSRPSASSDNNCVLEVSGGFFQRAAKRQALGKLLLCVTYTASRRIKADFESYDWVRWFRSQQIQAGEKQSDSLNEPRGEYFL